MMGSIADSAMPETHAAWKTGWLANRSPRTQRDAEYDVPPSVSKMKNRKIAIS